VRKLYNYSALSDEDDKIYSIGGTKISSTGISMASIKIIGPFLAIGAVFFILICVYTGKQYWNPASDDWNSWVLLLTVGLWGGIGAALFYIRVQSYRLYEWLFARLKPKYIYNNEGPLSRNRQKYTVYKIDGVVKDII
jgi:hypothetical protein